MIEQKYLSLSEYEGMKEEDKAKEKRIVLGDDAFAICELLEDLSFQFRRMANR